MDGEKMIRKEIDPNLPIEYIESTAEEKGGSIKVSRFPASRDKIYIHYPDCSDCKYYKNCGRRWENMDKDTNLLAQNCDSYTGDEK